MSKTRLSQKYRCWNDCDFGGCPSHEATLDYQSTSDALTFKDGKGREISMQTPELEALLRMVKELGSSRVELASVLKSVGLTPDEA